jgi:UDP-N-acetylmuramyl pentapeptide phosphotransferase/UDP-N-acetylglucosamine-1-phosphate transferase
MNSVSYYIFLGLGAFLFSLLGTRLTILGLRRRQILIDIPNARSNHAQPVPRGGGIAVTFALVVFFLLIEPNFPLALGLMLLAGISLVDDWIRLAPLTRLVVQLLAVGVMLPQIDVQLVAGLPHWLNLALVAVVWIWFINLFNFMDGIDGLAAGEAITVGLGILLVAVLTETFSDTLSLQALVLLCAAAGFLWWNWHPAKIFLGDVGSIPLGFAIGYLLLTLAGEGYGVAALILPAYFVADSTITLARRAWKREKIWLPHSQHFYQQAVRGGKSHARVVEIVLGVNLMLMALAAFSILDGGMDWLYLSVAYGMVVAVMWFFFAPHKKAS